MEAPKIDNFIVRDLRQKNHFVIDDIYLNGYARVLGAYSTIVYLSLCRHANFNTQKAFPSQKLIAYEHNISERQVRRELAKLHHCRLISITKARNSSTGQWLNDEYLLLDKSQWVSPEDYQSYGSPADYDDIHHRTTSPTKDSNKIKDSNIPLEKLKMDSPIGDLEPSYSLVDENGEEITKKKKLGKDNRAIKICAWYARQIEEITKENADAYIKGGYFSVKEALKTNAEELIRDILDWHLDSSDRKYWHIGNAVSGKSIVKYQNRD